MKRKHEIDMCNGPLLGKTLLFALPLMCSGVLQLLFNATDLVVVGRFAGSKELAAVGATGALINLIINVLMGLSVGTNVLVARFYGAKEFDDVGKAANTSVLISFLGGIAFGIIGFILAKPLLIVMGTPDDILNKAALYMRIYFCGLPVTALYNFGSAILRSIGDTRRPLIYLTIAGFLNVSLNVVFTKFFGMGVAGVALATVIAQCLSTGLVLYVLTRPGNPYSVNIKNLRVDWKMFRMIARVGIPAGLNGTVFSFSNAAIQSSVNYFGSTVVAGCSAASNIEGFLFTCQDAIGQSALAFTSQNMGAKRYDRINKILVTNVILALSIAVIGGSVFVLLRDVLLGIYDSNPEVIAAGAIKLTIAGCSYVFCAMMTMMQGMIRGLGYSLLPAIVSMLGACGVRIIWILTVFEANKTLTTLFLSYPVSWGITALTHIICFCIIKRMMKKETLLHNA